MGRQLLSVNNLKVAYKNGFLAGEKVILHDLNLAIAEGSITLLLGANGAGKTSLLKTIAGILPASPQYFHKSESLKARSISFMLSAEDLPQDFTWKELLSYKMKIHNIKTIPEIVNQFIPELKLDDFIALPFRQLSAGNQKKVAWILCCLDLPPLMLLDEPLTHLDIAQKEIMLSQFDRLKKNGHAFLIATHNWQEFKDMSDQLYCLQKGVIVMHSSEPREVALAEIIEIMN